MQIGVETTVRNAWEQPYPLRSPSSDPRRGPSVLVVADEIQVRRLIVSGLKLHGYVVREADGANAGLAAAAQTGPDMIVLDVGLPGKDGIHVIETVRSWSNIPIIVTSLERDENTKVHVLKSGADDYLVRPFGVAELAARCEVALRRYHRGAGNSPLVRTGRLTVDLVSRSVLLEGKPVTLTRKEYRLLHLLAARLGLVVTHHALIRDIWANTSTDTIQYLRMLVRKLRQKIEFDPGEPKLLISESGVGYRLERIVPSSMSRH